MAVEVLQLCGFEAGPISGVAATAPQELDNVLGQCKIEATLKRSGAYAVFLDYGISGANTSGDLPFEGRVSTTKDHRRVKFGLRVEDLGSGYSDAIWLWQWAAGQLGLKVAHIDSTYYALSAATSLVASVIWALEYGVDYTIELYWRDITDDGYVEVWVDNVSRITSSGADWVRNSTEDHLQLGQALGKDITEHPLPRMDDFWIQAADDEGDAIPCILPYQKVAIANLDGDLEEFTSGGTGSPDAADHYKNVDELPNTADVDYNESGVATAQKSELYNFESASEAGLGATDIIKAVVTKTVAKVTAGSNGVTSVLVKDDGTEYTTAMTPSGFYTDGTYDRVDVVMPNGSGAWTQARFDAFQAGMRRGAEASAMRNLRCTAVYVMVAYYPGRRFGAVPSDELVPNDFGANERNFGTVPSDEIVAGKWCPAERRFGAVPTDEQVPNDLT